jgi:hypothetical protein
MVNVPIGLLALGIGLWKLPNVPGHPIRSPRAQGALLVTVGVGALTFGIMNTVEWGWVSKSTATMTLGFAIIILCLFVIDGVRAKNPLVESSVFRVRPFLGANLAIAPPISGPQPAESLFSNLS